MATKEGLLLRATRLRASLALFDDPLGRRIFEAVIEALEEAAEEKDQFAGQKPADGKNRST